MVLEGAQVGTQGLKWGLRGPIGSNLKMGIHVKVGFPVKVTFGYIWKHLGAKSFFKV